MSYPQVLDTTYRLLHGLVRKYMYSVHQHHMHVHTHSGKQDSGLNITTLPYPAEIHSLYQLIHLVVVIVMAEDQQDVLDSLCVPQRVYQLTKVAVSTVHLHNTTTATSMCVVYHDLQR